MTPLLPASIKSEQLHTHALSLTHAQRHSHGHRQLSHTLVFQVRHKYFAVIFTLFAVLGKDSPSP